MIKVKYKLFTLIELLAVFVIMSILIAMAVGVYGLIINSNANTRTETTIKQLSVGMQAYKLTTGYYFQTPNDPFKTTLSEKITYANMANNVLTFNTDPMDTEFIRHFSYETFKSNGTIRETAPNSSSFYFIDAWDNPIIYRNPGEFNTTMFDIGSLGKDGKYGDNSDSADDFGQGDDITNFNK